MKHTVALAGLGYRGKVHLKGILNNPDRFELVGIYDPSVDAVKGVTEKFNVKCAFSSAEEMLEKTKPEVLVFVTQPDIRLDYVKLGVKHGVMGISFEKPMATSLSEAREITRLCVDNGIKAVVSHQQKYLKQMQHFYACVRSGILGEAELIRISTQFCASDLGTHFVDYALWANGGVGAEWVVGHVDGRKKLTNSHPSPDFTLGEVRLKNGATLLVECGYLAPSSRPAESSHDVDNRITVYGSHGYAWAETGDSCAVFSPETGGRVEVTKYPAWQIQEHEIQTPYYTDYANWLDNGAKHPCNVEVSLEGFEILEGIYKSALENIRVDLPIQGKEIDAIAEMKKLLPEQK
jgi:predicted dehydrogenase